MNEECAEVCGFDSVTESVGKTLFEVSKKESASQLIQNCNEVITTSQVKMFEEENLRKDGSRYQLLSIKSPWYNEENKIVGICGFSIALGKHMLADSLTTISKLGLLSSPETPPAMNYSFINNVYLSKREQECLRLSIKGYTAKRISRVLEISFRTVEEYLTNIKIKLGANSKAEMIEMATDYLFKNA